MTNCMELFKEIENAIKSLPTDFQPKMIGEGPVYNNTEIQSIIDKIDDCIKNAELTNHQVCVEKLKKIKGLLGDFSSPFTPMKNRPVTLNEIREILDEIKQNCF